MRARVLTLALLSCGALAAPARASDHWYLDGQGDPVLSAFPYGASDTTPTWSICRPGAEACEPYAANESGLTPGETPAGTSFELTLGSDVIRSPVWQGRVRATAPPAVTGTAAVGGTVGVTPATWTGGWGDEYGADLLVACQTATGAHCEPVGSLLEARMAGRSLFAVEWRDSPRNVIAQGSYAADFQLPAPSALMAVSAPYGPITGPPPVVLQNAPQVTPPSATVRARALRSHGWLSVARVKCAAACAVRVTVSDGHRTVRRALVVRGAARVRVPAGRLRGGTLRVKVAADGRQLASGRARL